MKASALAELAHLLKVADEAGQPVQMKVLRKAVTACKPSGSLKVARKAGPKSPKAEPSAIRSLRKHIKVTSGSVASFEFAIYRSEKRLTSLQQAPTASPREIGWAEASLRSNRALCTHHSQTLVQLKASLEAALAALPTQRRDVSPLEI